MAWHGELSWIGKGPSEGWSIDRSSATEAKELHVEISVAAIIGKEFLSFISVVPSFAFLGDFSKTMRYYFFEMSSKK